MLASGLIAGRYEIHRLLGSGGMGHVYLAFDQLLRRFVALKVFSVKEASSNAEAFLREARMAARLNHPNIVSVYDVGTADSLAFIAMEYIEGQSLAELAESPQPWSGVLLMAREILKGLAYAHGRGVIHRDIKPSNLIRMPDGRVVLLDLGISYALEATTETSPDGLMGTPAYMAPEQIRGESLDGRTDLFSLGSVLYHLLTSESPFQAPNLQETLAHVLHRIPPMPSSTQNIPQEFDRFVLKLLAKSPGKRFQSAEEALRALEGLQSSSWTIPVRPQGARSNSRLASSMSWGLGAILLSSVAAMFFSAQGPWNRLQLPPTPTMAPAPSPGSSATDVAHLKAISTLQPQDIWAAFPQRAPSPTPTPIPTIEVIELPTPTPQPPTPTPTPQPAASLKISVDQPARIFVESKLMAEGAQEREFSLKPGRYRIRAESLDGAQSDQELVNLLADVPQTIYLRLAPPPPGSVKLAHLNGMTVSVYVDGASSPTVECPCLPFPLAAGRHQLRFVNRDAGYERTQQVEVASGQTVTVQLLPP